MLSNNKTINIDGKLIILDKPLVMGVLNLTEDSFYSGSRVNEKNILEKSILMEEQGVDILDIGAQSSRPNAEVRGAEYEQNRLKSVMPLLRKKLSIPISIDTYHASVAKLCIDLGANIINDVTGGQYDQDMIPIVGKSGVAYICNHQKGNITEMMSPQNIRYKHLEEELTTFFIKKRNLCYDAGIKDMILDVGFGFSKSMENNFKLIKILPQLKHVFDEPIIIGISRKSSVYKSLNTSPEKALNGTIALQTIALMNGVDIVRVHDIKAAKDMITIFDLYKTQHIE